MCLCIGVACFLTNTNTSFQTLWNFWRGTKICIRKTVLQICLWTNLLCSVNFFPIKIFSGILEKEIFLSKKNFGGKMINWAKKVIRLSLIAISFRTKFLIKTVLKWLNFQDTMTTITVSRSHTKGWSKIFFGLILTFYGQKCVF